MDAKKIEFGFAARNKMLGGIEKLASAVGSTLGPGGRLVALMRDFGPVMLTKDGVTVAEEIHFKDQNEETGARLCKQVARQCDEEAGDGTTTATILAHKMIVEGKRAVDSGINPVLLKKSIDQCIEHVVLYLKDKSQPITLDDREQVKNIATISGNDEVVGGTVADAFIQAGPYGVVTMEDARGTIQTTVEKADGLEFDRGWNSTPAGAYFINNQSRMTVELDKPRILLWEGTISQVQDLVPLLEMHLSSEFKTSPLLIIADDVKDEALGMIVSNLPGMHEKSPGLRAAVVRAPRFGDQRRALMEDIALLVNGKFFSESMSPVLKQVKSTDLGSARKIIIGRESTVIYDGAGDKELVKEHVAHLHSLLTELENKHDRDKIKERIAKLSAGVVVIKVGAHNLTDMKEKKFRYEDAISATRSALQEGVLAGGGSTLLCASMHLEKTFKGKTSMDALAKNIVVNTLRMPVFLIAENAGYSGKEVINTLLTKNKSGKKETVGFNAATGKYGSMRAMGILDPTKVSRLAVENSSNIAGMFLTTEAVITDESKDDS